MFIADCSVLLITPLSISTLNARRNACGRPNVSDLRTDRLKALPHVIENGLFRFWIADG